jgi:hypothetical protein
MMAIQLFVAPGLVKLHAAPKGHIFADLAVLKMSCSRPRNSREAILLVPHMRDKVRFGSCWHFRRKKLHVEVVASQGLWSRAYENYRQKPGKCIS